MSKLIEFVPSAISLGEAVWISTDDISHIQISNQNVSYVIFSKPMKFHFFSTNTFGDRFYLEFDNIDHVIDQYNGNID